MSIVGMVADRFLRSRGSRLLSLIAIFAGLGVMLGVAVLDVTLAVMNGFRDQIQLKFVETMPMVTVMSSRGFDDLAGFVDHLAEAEDVEGAAPYIRNELVITHEPVAGRPRHHGAVLWGIQPERQDGVTRFSDSVQPPFLSFDTDGLIGGGGEVPGIVLGVQLAAELRAQVGDDVAIHAPRKVGPNVDDYETETRECLVVGVLESGMYEFDVAFAYMDLGVVQNLFGRGNQADGIGLRVADPMRAPDVADRLELELGYPDYYANDWISLNDQLFEWIQFEKALMFLLLTFLILIASFNVVAILITLVRDRSRDIAILSALGIRRRQVVAIFFRLGFVIGVVGTVAGTLIGLVAIVALDKYGFPLPGEVLFVDTLPVHPKFNDFALVAAVSMLMTFLATLLPSWLATRVSPVEVLRHD